MLGTLGYGSLDELTAAALPPGLAGDSSLAGLPPAVSEPEALRRINADGLLQRQTIPTPVQGRRLDLRDDLFAHDALVFDRIRSRSVIYGGDTGPRIEVSFPGMPMLGIWSKPGAGFVCIEPWQGVADEEGFDGDLYQRNGGFVVPPSGVHQAGFSITLLPE